MIVDIHTYDLVVLFDFFHCCRQKVVFAVRFRKFSSIPVFSLTDNVEQVGILNLFQQQKNGACKIDPSNSEAYLGHYEQMIKPL